MADKLARVAHSAQAFEIWYRDEVVERRLTLAEQRAMGALAVEGLGLLQEGATPLIEAAATPSPKR
jgi:hypothetical protein